MITIEQAIHYSLWIGFAVGFFCGCLGHYLWRYFKDAWDEA